MSCYVMLLKELCCEMEDGVTGLGFGRWRQFLSTFGVATLVFAVASILLILLFTAFNSVLFELTFHCSV